MAAKKKAKASKKAVKKKAPARKSAKKAKSAAKTKAKARKTPARKAAARQPAKKKAPVRGASARAGATKNKQKRIVGEGDYAASRAFLKDQTSFVKENKAKIPGLGKEARAALEGSEGPALLAAEAEARGHSKNQPEE